MNDSEEYVEPGSVQVQQEAPIWYNDPIAARVSSMNEMLRLSAAIACAMPPSSNKLIQSHIARIVEATARSIDRSASEAVEISRLVHERAKKELSRG